MVLQFSWRCLTALALAQEGSLAGSWQSGFAIGFQDYIVRCFVGWWKVNRFQVRWFDIMRPFGMRTPPANSNIDTKNDVFFSKCISFQIWSNMAILGIHISFPGCMTFKIVFCWKWIVSWSQKPIQVHVILNPVCPLFRGFKRKCYFSSKPIGIQKTNPHILEGTPVCDLVVDTYCLVISQSN